MKRFSKGLILLICAMLALMRIGGSQVRQLQAQSDAWPPEELWEKGDIASRVQYLEECAKRNSRQAAIRLISTKVLEDRRPEVRAAVVRGLASLTDAGARKFLVRQLSFPQPEIRELVAQAFALAPLEDALEPLLAQVKKENIPSVKAAMCAALGRYNSEAAVRALADATAQTEPRAVREASIAALGRIDLPEAIEALLACADERDWTLHELIEDGLARKREGPAAESVVKMLAAALVGDPASRRCEVAAVAAASHGDADLLEPLRTVLARGSPSARIAAAVALGRLQGAESNAVDALLEIIGKRDGTTSPELRIAACYSLPANMPPAAVERAAELLNEEKDWRVSSGLKYAIARAAAVSGKQEDAERALTPLAGLVTAGKLHSGDFKEILDSVFGVGFDGWSESFSASLADIDRFNKEWRQQRPAKMPLPDILSLRPANPPSFLLQARECRRCPRVQAVRDGLVWLLRNQARDGKWECARHNPYHGAVPALDFALVDFGYEDETTNPAVTALALLAFLAEGYSHTAGPCKEALRRAFDYLISCQDERSGLINLEKGHVHNEKCLPLGPDHGSRPRRYNHNISTLALVEGYAMSGDPVLKVAATRALDHSKNTRLEGGNYLWSYYLEPTDIGPSIYYIMALVVAAQTDLPVAKSELSDAKEYLRRITSRKEGRIYHLDRNPFCFGGFDSTATGIWAHRLLGKDAKDEFIGRAREFIAANPPTWFSFHQLDWQKRELGSIQENVTNEWYWLFGALAFRSLGADNNDPWLQRLEEILVEHQRRGGVHDGSWDPVGVWAVGGGRVYSTCFSITALQAAYAYKLK